MSDYNGWTNKETWLVNEWSTSEEYTYYSLIELVNDCTSKRDLENRLEEWILDMLCEPVPQEAGFAADLFQSAFGLIDLRELAEHYWEDYREEEEEEEEE